METMMQNHVDSCGEMLTEIVSRRWAKAQAKYWANGEAQTNDLQARGVKVEYRTVMGWRQGQLPINRHQLQLIRAGFKHMIDKAFEPAEMAGRIAEMEFRIAEQEQAFRAEREELNRIRQALAGFSDDLEG